MPLQDAWSKIGVTCNVSVIDSGVWSDARTNGDLEVTLVTWSTLSFQGVEHMGSYFRSDRAAKKSSFYNSTEFDNLVDQARLTVNNNDKVLGAYPPGRQSYDSHRLRLPAYRLATDALRLEARVYRPQRSG